MRILAAFEDECRSYGRSVMRALQRMRPHAEVATVEPDDLEAEVLRLDPQLVISCGLSNLAEPLGDRVLSWVELSQHPDQPWRIRVGEQRWEALNPSLDELLYVLDKTERLVRRMRRGGRSAVSYET